jgi:predicted signal transduction protein with EAL and GGDEF domain
MKDRTYRLCALTHLLAKIKRSLQQFLVALSVSRIISSTVDSTNKIRFGISADVLETAKGVDSSRSENILARARYSFFTARGLAKDSQFLFKTGEEVTIRIEDNAQS